MIFFDETGVVPLLNFCINKQKANNGSVQQTEKKNNIKLEKISMIEDLDPNFS
jgi:hypothetical protein